VKPTPTPTPSTSATAQPVLPQYVYGFEFKSFALTKTSLKALQAITAPAKVTVTVNGYADAKKSGGEDDVRLSLDRALTIKTALLKLHPTWTIKAFGLGHKVNAKCSMLTNRCAEIIIKKG
jgi:outer membrane protein OmpA-like peptidoglycan-associated protein